MVSLSFLDDLSDPYWPRSVDFLIAAVPVAVGKFKSFTKSLIPFVFWSTVNDSQTNKFKNPDHGGKKTKID